MNTNRKELVKILQQVKPGIDSKGIIEQTAHIMFSGQTITTYNDQICICFPFATDFVTSVLANDLYRALQKLKSDFVIITHDPDTGSLNFRDASTKGNLRTLVNPDQMVLDMANTLVAECAAREWKPLPTDFVQALNLCVFSASRDMSQGAFAGVSVGGKDVFTTDRFRCSWYEMDKEVDPFMISSVHAAELSGFPVTQYQLDENWAHFKTEQGVQFHSRRLVIMEGDFPNIKNIIEETDSMENVTKISLSNLPKSKEAAEQAELASAKKRPDTVADLVERVMTLTDTSDKNKMRIKMTFSQNTLTCSGSKELGSISSWMRIGYDGPEISFSINPTFLLQSLDKAPILSLKDKRALFKADKFQHVIALFTEEE